MLDYYLDRNVARAVKVGLRLRNVPVIDTDDDGTATLDDEALLVRAAILHRVLFTHDTDFLSLAAHWNQQEREHAGVVYVRMHRMSIGEIVLDLERLATQCSPEQLTNAIVYLPWRSAYT